MALWATVPIAIVVHRRLDNIAKGNRSLGIVTKERRDLKLVRNRAKAI